MQRYPLTWPAGWPRRTDKRTVARFSTAERRPGTSWAYRRDVTVAEAIQRVLGELSRIGVAEGDSIISTNLETRLDGLPRSNQPEPDDPGVAVYWQVIGSPMRVMAIDRYDTVAGNLAAIAATLDAMRAIERHGGAQILERAFAGFDALPAPGATAHWRDVLDVPEDSGNRADQLARAKWHYRAMASANHPDRGGDTARMAEINRAWAEAQRELGDG